MLVLERKFTCNFYTTAKALPTIKRVELINKKEFAKAALDAKSETFIMHIAALEALLARMFIHPLREAQIAVLNQKKAPTKVSGKYSDFSDVFSVKEALILLEQTKLSKHAIELKDNKQRLYRPIYYIGLMELKTLKTYIKTYLKTGLIWPSKFLAGALILFDKKPDGSLFLCINYWNLNNLTIKNQYTLFLIGKLLDWLGWIKRFT